VRNGAFAGIHGALQRWGSAFHHVDGRLQQVAPERENASNFNRFERIPLKTRDMYAGRVCKLTLILY